MSDITTDDARRILREHQQSCTRSPHYFDGFEAHLYYRAGEQAGVSPWAMGSPERDAWHLGWERARAEVDVFAVIQRTSEGTHA